MHRKTAVQEHIFAKWIAKGKSKEFGRSDFICSLSQNDFLQVGAGVLEGYSGDCSKPEPGVDAAAAVEGTCGRVRSGIHEAPGKVQSGKSNIQFFVKGKVGASTSVVRRELQEVLGRVFGVGGQDDVYATVGGRWVDLNSTLSCGGITTNCTVFLHYRLRGGSREKCAWTVGRVRVAMRSVVGLCVHGAVGVENLAWMLLRHGKAKAREEAKASKPCAAHGERQRAEGCSLQEAPPCAGLGPSPFAQEGNAPNEDMIKALILLQSVMSTEDFSEHEKMVLPPKKEERVKLREQELFLKRCRSRVVRRSKSRCTLSRSKSMNEHNLAQQRLMLDDDVQVRLGAVRDEVNALRVWSRRKRSLRDPPLPCLREPPPGDDENPAPVQDRMSDGVNLNVAATPIDADAEMEEDDEWQTVRAKSKKKKVLMKFKKGHLLQEKRRA